MKVSVMFPQSCSKKIEVPFLGAETHCDNLETNGLIPFDFKSLLAISKIQNFLFSKLHRAIPKIWRTQISNFRAQTYYRHPQL